MSNLVEGVDYLFDRYAFLKIAPTASAEEIARAIKLQKAENHPDKYLHASEDARKLAEHKYALILKCEATLTDETSRAKFNERLAYFQQSRPDTISVDGIPIQHLGYSKVDLQALLHEPVSVADYEQRVAQLTGFKPTTLAILERLYQANPLDKDARIAYQDELAKGITQLALLQSGVWQQAGIHIGHKDQPRLLNLDDISDQVMQRITMISESLPQKVTEHVGLLTCGMAKPLLLTGPNAASGNAVGAVIDTNEIIEHAKANLTARTHRVKELATRQQDMTSKLLATLQTWQISPEGVDTEDKRICLMYSDNGAEPTCIATFGAQGWSINQLDTSFNGKTVKELKECSEKISTMAIEMHSEIGEPLLCASYLLNKMNKDPEKEAPTRG
jgi:DnaJ domain